MRLSSGYLNAYIANILQDSECPSCAKITWRWRIKITYSLLEISFAIPRLGEIKDVNENGNYRHGRHGRMAF